jgi:hypothetical protein
MEPPPLHGTRAADDRGEEDEERGREKGRIGGGVLGKEPGPAASERGRADTGRASISFSPLR